MTDLVIGKIGWQFGTDVPFLWQPNNPSFAMFCNVFTFIAVPFELYIIKALRPVRDTFTDPAVAAKADAFRQQEGPRSGWPNTNAAPT